LVFGTVSELSSGEAPQRLRDVTRAEPSPRRRHREEHQQPMQAPRAIHVAQRSTAFMGLQFNDPSYNRPMSSGGGAEPRRLKGRLPSAFWVGGGLLLLLAIIFLARQIILPFLLAIFLTYLLLPLVKAMTGPGPGGRRTPRALAAFLALAAFMGLVVVAILV